MSQNVDQRPKAITASNKPASFQVWRGQPYPLGATWDGYGVNFALFSEHASAVELCLFQDAEPSHEITRIPIKERTDQVWHVYIPALRPGQKLWRSKYSRPAQTDGSATRERWSGNYKSLEIRN